MIPLHLKLSGFLSYRDPVELDFSSFDLACISGQNGAGKSSLLDAITWALFGQARKRDESVVNLQSKVAEVIFTFSYEGGVYRVIRALPRGKTTTLEFQIQQSTGEWRPLTERILRDTQARIESILRLDYETFVNAAFFLQGKADQFAQQSPSRRKDILSNILGLETWEIFKERAAEHRKEIESELESLTGRIQEIDAELAEEPIRTKRLTELDVELKNLTAVRKAQETALASVKQARAALDKQKELTLKLSAMLERGKSNLSGIRSRLDAKLKERDTYKGLLARASDVESAYTAWQSARAELQRMDTVAIKFHEFDDRRQPYLVEIGAEKARLEQEYAALGAQQSVVEEQTTTAVGIQKELDSTRKGLSETDRRIRERDQLQRQAQEAREKIAEARAENESLRGEMDELRKRIEDLEAAEGASCPLCGQPLSPDHRKSTLGQLKADGKAKGDRWRSNKAVFEDLSEKIRKYESDFANFRDIDEHRMKLSSTIAQLTERLETLKRLVSEWKKTGAKRQVQINRQLESGKYAGEARRKLAKVDKELSALGYDTAAHEAVRRNEVQARTAEEEFRRLESARAALRPLEDEIANLQDTNTREQNAVSLQQKEYDESAKALSEVEAAAPDLDSAERLLFDMQEQENRLNQEVGAARQKVTVLDDLRKRRKNLETGREEYSLQIGRYKTLERAFGKDGVPALLIEQALPEIETKANEILDRLSDGTMSVRFVTQSAYKDRKREDLKETLDIQISDGAGVRDYEMYSGGEAFRANFAIRLALSEVLARRKGARLQTLVIDEGFGSQDTQGRQRLIESINAVRGDFAKILVITHLDELKDAFPTRIEVEKTEKGSTVRIT